MTPRTIAAEAGLLVAFCCSALLTSCSTPRVDVRAEADAIRKLSTEWLAAEVSKDVEGAVAMYADDAVELPSNTPMVVGKEAIRTWYKGWLPDPSLSVTFATVDVAVAASGDLAYERGTYRLVVNGPKGRTEDVGKYLTVWKRVGGTWKVHADMNASDQPVPGT